MTATTFTIEGSVRRDNGRRERLWLSPECHHLHQQALDFGVTA